MVVYTALGDSITAGAGATSFSRAYPNRIIGSLRARGVRAVGRILAHSGWTSRALDDAVFANPAECLTQSTAITIWIGGDNLAYAGLSMLRGAPASMIPRAIQSYVYDVAFLVTEIRKVSRAKIILCTQYNPFPNSPIAIRAISALNASTCTLAEKLRVGVAPTASWIDGQQGRLIAGYRTGRIEDVMRTRVPPIHPNDGGHAVIAHGLIPYIDG